VKYSRIGKIPTRKINSNLFKEGGEMKNKKLTLICISLLLVLIFGLLSFTAGCTSNSTTTTTPPKTTAPATTTAPAPATSSTASPATSPVAASVIKLTFGGIYTAPHPEALADLDWIDKIQKDSNGRVQIQFFPGSTLVSTANCFAELQSGVADISYTNVGSQPYGYDIHRNSQPFLYGVPNGEMRIKIYKELADKFPEIKAEFDKAKILGIRAGNNYQLITRKPVRTPEDIKALTIRAMGATGNWFKAMGGEGVAIPMGETYLSLQKGIVDGAFAPFETLKTFAFGEVAKYVTVLNVTTSPYYARAMNWNVWNKLPPDIQKIFNDNYDYWGTQQEKYYLQKDEEGIAEGKKQGVEFITPPAAELDKFYQSLNTTCQAIAKDMDSKGFKGTAIFNEYRALAQKYTGK
jgi:TRAP-type transport system periplasmic protein